MHLVVVIDSLGLGGAERLLVTLARHAPTAGIMVSVVSLREVESSVVSDQLREAGAEVRCVPTASRHHLADPRRLVQLSRVLRALDADVVQTHLGTATVLGVLGSRAARLPVVGTLHTVRLPDRGPRARAVTTALRRADAVIAVGAEVARTHASVLAPHPITVVPNPVDVRACAAWGPDTPMLRRELLGDRTGPLVLSVGRLEPPKGHLLLLDALRLVVDRHPDAVLAIAGDGSLRDAVRGRVEALGLDGNVRLLGVRRDVPELLAAADVFVNASDREGLPLAVLEAMAAGRPVVATDVGDVGAVLGDAGLLVPSGQAGPLAAAVEVLLADGDRRMRLAVRGREIVTAHYDPDRWIARLHGVYADVAAGRRVA